MYLPWLQATGQVSSSIAARGVAISLMLILPGARFKEDEHPDGCESYCSLMVGGEWEVGIGVESIWTTSSGDMEIFIGAFMYQLIHEVMHGVLWELERISSLHSEYTVYSLLRTKMLPGEEKFYKAYYSL